MNQADRDFFAERYLRFLGRSETMTLRDEFFRLLLTGFDGRSNTTSNVPKGVHKARYEVLKPRVKRYFRDPDCWCPQCWVGSPKEIAIGHRIRQRVYADTR